MDVPALLEGLECALERRVEAHPAVDTSNFEEMDHVAEAEGWYEDPFALHEQRWFSAGHPSSLVKDGRVESKDPPPSEVFGGPLVEIVNSSVDGGDGSDQRRVGDRMGDPYDPGKASDAAFDASTWFPIT